MMIQPVFVSPLRVAAKYVISLCAHSPHSSHNSLFSFPQTYPACSDLRACCACHLEYFSYRSSSQDCLLFYIHASVQMSPTQKGLIQSHQLKQHTLPSPLLFCLVHKICIRNNFIVCSQVCCLLPPTEQKLHEAETSSCPRPNLKSPET